MPLNHSSSLVIGLFRWKRMSPYFLPVFVNLECVTGCHYKVLTFKADKVAVISPPLSNEYPNVRIWIVSTTTEDHETMGRKRHKTDMGKFIKVITVYCVFKTGGKYIKSMIFILVDFIKQTQDYSSLHLKANKNFSLLSEFMFFQENEEKWA